MSGRCVYPVCTGQTEGMAMICDKHRAERIAECKQRAASPGLKPFNPMCNHGYHQKQTAYGRATGEIARDGQPILVHQACTECHYCGEVHPYQVAA